MNVTKIQWTDSTVNPAMGCGGCELFPESPRKLMASVDEAVITQTPSPCPGGGALGPWTPGTAQKIMMECIHRQIVEILKHPGFRPEQHQARLTTTNVWHMRKLFAEVIETRFGKETAKVALEEIHRQITCYAAKLHLNRGYSILNPGRGINRGYAPTFEELTLFPGRVAEMARSRDLIGFTDPNSPWKGGLPRLVFVSDMGDALTQHSAEHLDWLDQEVLGPIRSQKGRRHLWLWLTKRPGNMAKLARRVGGLPKNVCAMTTLTSGNARSLKRLEQLKEVNATSRGLSIEPLWERIPPENLNLAGVDWLILGGESGDKNVRPFDLARAGKSHRLHFTPDDNGMLRVSSEENPGLLNRKLALVSPDDCQAPPERVPVHPVAEGFLARFQMAMQTVSKDPTRTVITGVCLDGPNIVGTDGRRLTAIHCPEPPLDTKVIVPAHKFWNWTRLAETGCRIGAANGWFRMACGYWSLQSRVIDGTFPNWEQVVPDGAKAKRLVLHEDDILALREALAALPYPDSSAESKPVALLMGPEGPVLAGRDNNGNWSHARLAASTGDPGFGVTVDRSYLRTLVEQGFRELLNESELQQVLSRMADGSLHVVMPMRADLPEPGQIQTAAVAPPTEPQTDSTPQIPKPRKVIPMKETKDHEEQAPDVLGLVLEARDACRDLSNKLQSVAKQIREERKANKALRTELQNARQVLEKLKDIAA